MMARRSLPFTRRRLLAAAVAAVFLPSLRSVFGRASTGVASPLELPLSAVDLYGPHDLAG